MITPILPYIEMVYPLAEQSVIYTPYPVVIEVKDEN